MNTADTRRFGGISRLFGREGFETLTRSHVAVVGVGGVGSWVAEALARTAVGKITIIDGDTVEESNTNRQLPAMDGQYGRKKVDVLAERLRAINPKADIVAVDQFVSEANFDELIPSCDALIDCIDSLGAKTFLVARGQEKARFVLTSGGAGGKVAVAVGAERREGGILEDARKYGEFEIRGLFVHEPFPSYHFSRCPL